MIPIEREMSLITLYTPQEFSLFWMRPRRDMRGNERPTSTIIDEINDVLAKERFDLPDQDTYPPFVESIGMALEITPDVINWWAENDAEFREGLENTKEVDGANIALLLMETQKRYTV